MARLVSELGDDVFDDTIDPKKVKDPKKRNYTIGFSLLGVGIVALGLIYYFAATDWLSDYKNMSYIDYSVNLNPDTDGPYKGKVTATITSVNSNKNYPSTFEIPTKIKGHYITGIDDDAFQGCTRLTKVIMPNSIRTLGNKVFNNCEKLKTIKFSKNLVSIGDDCFEGTLYKKSWENNEFTYVNNILLDVNEQKLLSDYGKSSIAFVANKDSKYVSEYSSSSLVFSLETLSPVIDGAKENNVKITQWMNGIFSDFSSLKFVELPSYFDTIPESSFKDCTHLTTAVLNNNIHEIGSYAFSGCSLLSNIELPNDLDVIGDYAFEGTDLSATGLNEGVTELGKGAFKNCEKITSFVIPSTISQIKDETFRGTSLSSITFTNEENITAVGAYAFANTKFTTFTFPRKVESVSNYVFYDCDELVSVATYNYDTGTTKEEEDDEGQIIEVPVIYGPTKLGAHAFDKCDKFVSWKLLDENGNPLSTCTDNETVYLPTTLTTSDVEVSSGEGSYNFASTPVKHVVISNKLSSLGSYIFYNCANLEDVTFGSDSILRTIGEKAFYGCTSLTSIELPNMLKTLGTRAFEGCNKLESVSLPDITKLSETQRAYFEANYDSDQILGTIRVGVFKDCSALKGISFPAQYTKIDKNAFENCTSLTNVIIPTTLNVISEEAFTGCTNLYLSINAASIPESYVTDWDSGLNSYVTDSTCVVSEGNWVYSINKSDETTITIVRYLGEETEIVIPSTISGLTVSRINVNFLVEGTTVTKVTKPANVTMDKGAVPSTVEVVDA